MNEPADTADSVTIEPLLPTDWPAVKEIYEQGIAGGNATFESAAPEWEEWDRSHRQDCRFVARRDRVLGWAALAPVSSRCVYGGVAEVSVYVRSQALGAGVGTALLASLIRCSEAAGLWTLEAGIFPENAASVKLFERHQFRLVGRRERLGQHHGHWRDVLLYERRSRAVG